MDATRNAGEHEGQPVEIVDLLVFVHARLFCRAVLEARIIT